MTSETVGHDVDPRQPQPTYPPSHEYFNNGPQAGQQAQPQYQSPWQQSPPAYPQQQPPAYPPQQPAYPQQAQIPTQMAPAGWPPAPQGPRHSALGLPPRPRRSRKWMVIAGVAVLVVAGAGTGLAMATGSGVSANTRYLQALRAEGMGGQFSSDAVALAHGHAVCTRLQAGAAAQGSAVDQVGVQYFCPTFTSGFHVLEKADVQGTFEIDDSEGSYGLSPGISVLDDGSCTGTGGYDDIGEGTTVVVKDDTGKTLTTTSLGAGTGTDTACTFSFDFPVTEGSSDYVVTVSHRGDQHYSFTTLQNDGVSLTLGS